MPEEIPTQPEETKTVTEVVSEIEKSPEVQVPVKSKPWLKPLLFSILGIILAAGLVFAGYKLGQKKFTVEFLGPQLAPTPTPVVVATPTPIFTLEATPSLTVTPKPISIPEDWQEFTATDYEFGIKTTLSLPPGFSFSFSGSEFTIQNADATELWDYATSVYRDDDGVLKNHYDGGSRRTWYQDYLSKKQSNFDYKDKIVNTLEIPFDGTSYLRFSVETPAYNEHGVYSGTKMVYHYLYVQNNIIHIITPASEKATAVSAQIPKYINIIFFSLRSTQIK